MTDFYEQIKDMSPKRLLLLAMELQSKVEDLERAKSEPIAIVGMGMRFPGGVNSQEAFWELLRSGTDAITEIPASRWDVGAYYDPDPDAPAKIATRWGGFIDDIDRFEPQVFGISPREAITMDPQQRILLEVVWEALERAGYAPPTLNGSQTGVFVGVCNSDYCNMLTAGDPSDWDMYISTGNAHSVISGRVSYILGLHGPAVSVDTACSSSLVAVHLAVQSLRRGECRMALAGGTNAILSPLSTIMLSRAGMMAADGHCKAFDAAADGFVRAEGCGVVVLKRLSDAIEDGDNVLAVILGSAINQDGRSNGLTAPNGPSQVAVIRAALADAQLDPSEVSYVETHGTGTSLGDPIEAQALGAALGVGHSTGNPLIIGSLKANMGHMESAAGIGGLIKAVLMLKHGEIPPQLHLNQPNPYIPWDELPLKLVKNVQSWEGVEGHRVAGVSSFGFSGTNAHVLLEAAPQLETAPLPEADRPKHVLAFSARSESALRQFAVAFRDALSAQPELSPADLAYSTHASRATFTHRLAVTGATAGEMSTALDAYLAGEQSDRVTAGRASSTPEVAFLFTGHGSQYVDMGRHLYETQAAYRQAFDECDALFQPYLNIRLGQIVFQADGADGALLNQMTYAQPVLFALQYALGRLWQSWSIQPSVMMGHSLGEYAAAVIAGVFSLEDGVKLVAARGRLFDAIPEAGEMVAVFGDEATVTAAVAPYANRVSVAAINGETNIVISGVPDALAAVLETLKSQKIKSRKLAVAQAAHSPLLDPILDEFESIAATVTYHEPEITLVSGLTGKAVNGAEITNARFWRQHLRQTVRFADALHTVYEQGVRVFLEIGPNPTLIGMGQRELTEPNVVWLPSLRDTVNDWTQLLTSLGGLYVAGAAVDWRAYDASYPRRKVDVPTYPFQRERYWFTPSAPKLAVRGGSAHPLIGQRLSSPSMTDYVFETQLSAEYPAFLSHHRIFDVVILPSPAYIEMVLAAAQAAFGEHPYAVENFSIDEALILPDDGLLTLQTILSPEANGRSKFEVFSESDGGWKRHASGSILLDPQSVSVDLALDPAAFQSQSTGQIVGDEYYGLIAGLGLEFGTNFKGITHLWYTTDQALAEIHLPDDLLKEARSYGIHPALLDACFHAVGAPLLDEYLGSAYLLIGIDHFQLLHAPEAKLWAAVDLQLPEGTRPEILTGSIHLLNEDGTLVAVAHGLQLKRAARAALLQGRQRLNEWLYDVEWPVQPHPEPVHTITPASFIPPVQTLADSASTELRQLASSDDVRGYEAYIQELNSISTTYVVQTLSALGANLRVGEVIQPERLGVVARHQRLLGWLLESLAQDGFLTREGQGWRVLQTPQSSSPDAELERLIRQFPQYGAEAALLVRCAPRLAEVLRGQQDPLELLFPQGSMELTERLYRDAPLAQVYNTLVAQIVTTAASHLPQGRSLRVLEVGAGTGSTTAYVLPALDASRTEYTFTDLSNAFLNRAEDTFSGNTALRTQLLDIEVNPFEQDLSSDYFDVVIAANVLHATTDLRQTLENVRQTLAPEGLLVLLEGTQPQRWVDLTFGLTEGWWRFADDTLRPQYPLLAQSGWQHVLAAAGFKDAVAVTDESGIAASQAIILARAPQPSANIGLATPTSNSLVFADTTGIGAVFAERLAEHGTHPLIVTAGASFQRLAGDRWVVNLNRRDDFTRLWDEVRSLNGLPCSRVVYLWSLDTPDAASLSAADLQAAELETSGSLLWLTQAVLASNEVAPPALWLVTRGAVSADNQTPVTVAQSPLWGLGRVIALEQPQLWGGLVDLDVANLNLDNLLSEVLKSDGEDQVAWRGGKRHVARLVRSTPVPSQPVILQREGVYLLTGALGGLGLNVARWLAERGAGHLVLTSRSGLPDRSTWDDLAPDSRAAQHVASIRAIEALGASVTVAAVDVADEASMTRLFEQIGSALRGVIHAAADQNNTAIADLTEANLQAMFQPKIAGTWVLHRLTQHLNLDFFVLFSSTTALWGSRLLGHYAAANAFLDAFAHYRHQLGLPALSINWGTWDIMRVASAEEKEFVSQSGLDRMPFEQALQIMGDFLGATDRTQLAVAAVEWERLKAVYEARRERPFLKLVGSTRQPARTAQPAAKSSDLLERLSSVAPEAQLDLLIEHIRAQAALVLRVADASSIDVEQGLFDMGMDSLMSVELKTRLETSVEQSLPSTLTFNYPTILELAGFLQQKLGLLQTAPVEAEPIAETPAPTGALPDELDDMSEDDLADLLAKKLGL
ncbi:MAG: polyketide synthase dehydratase domain-containing protein [Chloroflexi bacterium]|nr:polyketide synthase dehydratase domain-containing protein [Chloroflexota bacterium]MCC6892487.1 polyketide synthase dehydratase domain-containing protein [Anaerolineae bacterium]